MQFSNYIYIKTILHCKCEIKYIFKSRNLPNYKAETRGIFSVSLLVQSMHASNCFVIIGNKLSLSLNNDED